MRANLSVGLILAGAAAAQQVAVSPAPYRDRWAYTRQFAPTEPFGPAPVRWVFLYSDAPAMTVSSVSWRQRGYFFNPTGAGGDQKTIDLEMWIGEGPIANCQLTYSRNFATPPVLAIQRRTLNWPAVNQAPTRSPGEMFRVTCPLDQPVVYSRTYDLVCMVDQHRTTPDQGHLLDLAVRAHDEEFSYESLHGMGCYNTWNNGLAELHAESAGSRSRQTIRLTSWASGLRPNALASMLFGAAGTPRQYPFLCNFLYVDTVWHSWLGLADAQGAVPQVTYTVAYDPNLVGHTVHMQAYCLDDGRHPLLLPVTLTNGLEVALANIPPPWVPCCTVAGNIGQSAGGRIDELAPIVELR